MGLGLFHSLVRAQLGEALFLAGEFEEAYNTAEGALTLARKRGEQGHEAYALRVLGDIATHSDLTNGNSAESSYQSALALTEKHGMRPLQAHCHLGLGRLYQQQKNESQGQQFINTAATMYRDLGMTSWEERAI